MRSRLVDIDCIEIWRTAKAVLVQYDEDVPYVWLPLSQVEIETQACADPRVEAVVVTMPESLAIEMGMA